MKVKPASRTDQAAAEIHFADRVKLAHLMTATAGAAALHCYKYPFSYYSIEYTALRFTHLCASPYAIQSMGKNATVAERGVLYNFSS